MAIVKAPFLSLSARGKLDKALICRQVKGRSIMSEYYTPTYPNSPDQQTYRANFQLRSGFWSRWVKPWNLADAWPRKAQAVSRLDSGYTLYMTNIHNATKVEAAPPVAWQTQWTIVNQFRFYIFDIDGVSPYTGGKSGTIRYGTVPGEWTEVNIGAMAGFLATTVIAGNPGDILYAELVYTNNKNISLSGWGKFVRD